MRKLIVLMLLMLAVPTMAIAVCEDGETTYFEWTFDVHFTNDPVHSWPQATYIVFARTDERARSFVESLIGKRRVRGISLEKVEEKFCPAVGGNI